MNDENDERHEHEHERTHRFATPGEASRAGLSDSSEAGNQLDAPTHAEGKPSGPHIDETPMEEHRGGPLPYMKR